MIDTAAASMDIICSEVFCLSCNNFTMSILILLFTTYICVTLGFKYVHLRSPRTLSSSIIYRSCHSIFPKLKCSSDSVVEAEVVRNENEELDVGDFDSINFVRITDTFPVAKYAIEGTLKSKELNSYLNEYKAEMKKRKVTFPGFRAGNIPPYAMTDVRRYIVCYGLELTLGSLCNNNGLIMCEENGDDVPFGEDRYYEQIFQKDFRDYDFLKQRDAWKEGTDFKFKVEFFARETEESERSEVVDTEEISST